MISKKTAIRLLLSAGGAGLMAATVAVASSEAHAGAPGDPVPANLAVPAGQTLTANFTGRGVQVYRCTGGAWTFVEPAATLSGRATPSGQATQAQRHQSAVHFRGPSWESTTDGSLVEAKAIASSPVPGSIPELLLQATTNRGDGVFGQVSYVQRLRTSGGAAPAGTCAEGQTTGVPYRAQYLFFSPTAG